MGQVRLADLGRVPDWLDKQFRRMGAFMTRLRGRGCWDDSPGQPKPSSAKPQTKTESTPQTDPARTAAREHKNAAPEAGSRNEQEKEQPPKGDPEKGSPQAREQRGNEERMQETGVIENVAHMNNEKKGRNEKGMGGNGASMEDGHHEREFRGWPIARIATMRQSEKRQLARMKSEEQRQERIKLQHEQFTREGLAMVDTGAQASLTGRGLGSIPL